MPMFMLNGNQYGGNGGNYQVARMSKADYDALTDEQKNDGTLRIVVDTAGNSVNYMSAQVAGAKTDDTLTNLLNPTLGTTTSSGATITNNGDGTFTLNATNTSEWSNFPIETNLTLEAGKTYKICGGENQQSTTTYLIELVSIRTSDGHRAVVTNEIQGNTFVALSGYKYELRIHVFANATITNALIKPMLTPDLQATYDDFVGYTGGTGRLNSDVAAHQKEISRINSDLSDSHKHTISNDTVVRLTKNQSYTTLADGYFCVNFNTPDITGGEYAYGKIDGITLFSINAPSSNVHLFGYTENAVFVRKGSVISFDGSTHATGVFYPLG